MNDSEILMELKKIRRLLVLALTCTRGGMAYTVPPGEMRGRLEVILGPADPDTGWVIKAPVLLTKEGK